MYPIQQFIELLITYAINTPIRTGEISAFIKIDEDGNIIPPEWAHELDHVFD